MGLGRGGSGGGGGPSVITSIEAMGAGYTVPITAPISANMPVGQSFNGGILRIITNLAATTIADISKITVRVRDNGFDGSGNATTVDRTLTILGHYLKTYNNETVTMPGIAGQFDVVLSDWLYNQDVTNKTTILGVDFVAGWCTGGLTESVTTVTRSDSLAYPNVIVRPHTLPYERVLADGTNSTTEWAVSHRLARQGRSVAYFRVRANVAGTQGAWVGTNAEVRSALTPSAGRNPSGLAAPVFSVAGSVAGLADATAAQAGNWEWQAYPWIGPMLDSTTLLTPSDITAGGGTVAQADMGASAAGADYNPMQMPNQFPFVLDATTPCYNEVYAWVNYDGVAGASPTVQTGTSDPGTVAGYATFAAAAAALKTYNNARATGAHNDIGGGVIMLRSVVGSVLGGFAGGYSTGTNWSAQTTYACGIGRVEVRAVGGLPDTTIRMQGCTSAGVAITSTNHAVAQRTLWRGITFDGDAGFAVGGASGNIIIDGGSTDGAPTTRRTETGTVNAAVSMMLVDCDIYEAASGSGANPCTRQAGYMYWVRTTQNNAFTSTAVGGFTTQFAGMIMNVGCLMLEGNQDMPPCLLSGSRIQSTFAAGANGFVVIRGAYNQPRPLNIIWQHSRVDYSSGTTKAFFCEGSASQTGLMMRGLFTLRTGTTSTPIGFSISADNNWYDATNVTMHGCGSDMEGSNVISNRINIGYNDIGWNPVKRDIIDSYNALSCYAIKTTWFNNTGLPTTLGTTHTTARIWLRGDIVVDATNTYQALQDVPTGTLLTNTAYWQDNGLKSVAYGMQPGRVGNEAHTWHVGKYGTVGVTNAAGETAPGFETYFGKVWQPGGQLNTTYANWYTTRSTALGTPGDYSPPGGSPLLNRIPAGMAWGPFDMYGTTIPNDGTGAAGAYQ